MVGIDRDALSAAEPARGPLDAARSLPSRFFTDPAIFDVERELIFARSWISVAREEDLTESGDYVAVDIAGEPVVVVRGRDEELRAFSNVCRHRNTVIVEGSGHVNALQCPYHLWTYGLDGHLVGAPRMELSDTERDDLCLPSLGVECWQGWAFVNVDGTAAPLAPQVRGLEEICAPYELERMQRVGVVDCPGDWNWKISLENFAESYHHAGTHPTVLQTWAPGERSWAEDNRGEPWLSLDHVSTDDNIEPFTASVAFPMHMFSIARPSYMTWFNLRPTAVDHVDLRIEVFAHPDAMPVPDIVTETVEAINDEDIVVNERTSRGLHSRFASPGPVSPLEEACWQFRRWYLEQVTTTDEESVASS